jgi:hypothetical protein
MEILPVGAELFYAGRRTGMTELIVAFRNFANVPKKGMTERYGKLCSFQDMKRGFRPLLRDIS